ncbi:hypothetical protein F4775DRAFT_7774 [Biscogniauxia sp. FL1348]|nr:hypothetical protein F4775DRAFT_7774 [Biscogniauxia sp. FL1348]
MEPRRLLSSGAFHQDQLRGLLIWEGGTTKKTTQASRRVFVGQRYTPAISSRICPRLTQRCATANAAERTCILFQRLDLPANNLLLRDGADWRETGSRMHFDIPDFFSPFITLSYSRGASRRRYGGFSQPTGINPSQSRVEEPLIGSSLAPLTCIGVISSRGDLVNGGIYWPHESESRWVHGRIAKAEGASEEIPRCQVLGALIR